MNGQLISTAISDKSVMSHTTGQEDTNRQMFTTAGHILLSSCEILSAVLKWHVLRVGSAGNFS